MKTEPVTKEQVAAMQRSIERAHGRVGAMLTGLWEVDLTKGRGILEGNTRCLWTQDGRRITIALPADGGLIVSCGKARDPECPQ